MALDQQFIDQMKGFEGFRESPYWDHKQYSSGYGTKANSPDEVIDRATADQRLKVALDQAAAHVDAVNPNLPAGARAALISLTYNAGPGWASAGLGDLVRNGDLQGAQARLLEYNKASGEVSPGLVKRRAAEAAWFGLGGPTQAALTAAPAPAAAPANTIPAQTPPVFAPPPQQAQQQAAQPQSLMDVMPAELPIPPPIFAQPRFAKLKIPRPFGGLIFARR